MKFGFHTTRRIRVSACWPHQHALRLQASSVGASTSSRFGRRASRFGSTASVRTVGSPATRAKRPFPHLRAPAPTQRAHWVRCGGKPNPSLNPRRATASVVSLVRGTQCIIAYQAYAARLRARG